jgi:hypothetical protein
LYYFLAAVLLIYFIVPFKVKNLVLLLASLFFYFYGEPVYTLLMLATILSSYIHGLLIDRFRGTVWAKVFLWSSVVTSLGALGFFKYSDFLIINLNNLLPKEISESLKEAFYAFDKKIPGFNQDATILAGIESRTSSPIRIPRNENLESTDIKGLYPCGEGAGYAGGITTSAMDGLKVAEKIIEKYYH